MGFQTRVCALGPERRFHYREWGKPSAPGLLFLHGGNQTCHTWNVICAALSDQYHCIALDQRGHGDSEWSYEGDYAPASQMEDIVALIKHLEWPSLIIIGMSMGCLVGLYYAIKYCSSLNAFVAIDAGPYVEPAGAAKIKNFIDDNRRHGSLESYIAAAVAFNPRRNPQLLRHSLQRNLRRLVDGRWEWKTDNRITQQIPQLLKSIKELAQHIR
ncbi:MAG: alpha/beta hydrolase [Proteobacteria bacterium]|nr:alpha/beta hydrolase [Pseudomonadota bacterium]